ncbi:lysophospholipid acyltransferase family protein [soil metagenome]
MIRSVWVILNLIVVTIPLALVIIVASFFRNAPESIYDGIPRIWAGWMLRVSGVRVQAFGLAHIPMGSPVIFIANHASWFDVLALACVIPKRYRFVGKKELTRVPLWGRAWQAAGHIAIDRSDTQRAVESLDRAARLVREDRSSIIIFPEGTRSPDGQLQPFKKGAFMLALHTGIDIIPVALQGTRALLAKGSWRVRPGRIIVRFGSPIVAASHSVDTRDDLMAQVRTGIQSMLDAPAPGTSESDVGH